MSISERDLARIKSFIHKHAIRDDEDKIILEETEQLFLKIISDLKEEEASTDNFIFQTLNVIFDLATKDEQDFTGTPRRYYAIIPVRDVKHVVEYVFYCVFGHEWLRSQRVSKRFDVFVRTSSDFKVKGGAYGGLYRTKDKEVCYGRAIKYPKISSEEVEKELRRRNEFRTEKEP